MLLITKKLLKAAGFEYDDIGGAWVTPMSLRPVVIVQYDGNRAYLTRALHEVHAVLEGTGCTYSRLALNDSYVSVVGLTVPPAAAAG